MEHHVGVLTKDVLAGIAFLHKSGEQNGLWELRGLQGSFVLFTQHLDFVNNMPDESGECT